nr:reverse transcriptase domain-containing protein [Tanacetum cinerariifolium]
MTMTYEAPVSSLFRDESDFSRRPFRVIGWCVLYTPSHGVDPSTHLLLEESTEDFVQRFKAESRQVKGVPECMRIFGFMHEITNPELIKCLYDKILKSGDEMMKVTIAFLRGEVAASNQAWKKTLSAWKQQETGRKQNFEKREDFRNQQRSERRLDNFTLLPKSLKETLALDKRKLKAPTPMTIPLEKETTTSSVNFIGK